MPPNLVACLHYNDKEFKFTGALEVCVVYVDSYHMFDYIYLHFPYKLWHQTLSLSVLIAIADRYVLKFKTDLTLASI